MASPLGLDADRLRAMFAAGANVAEVCRETGAAHGTVCYWREKLGFAPTRRRKIDPVRLAELHASKLGDRDVAAVFGCTPHAVKLARRKYGLVAWNKELPSYRARQRENYRRRCEAAGVRSLRTLSPEAHVAARRRLTALYGLPGDLYAVQVAVVVALAGGPRTARELADLCGRGRASANPYHRFNNPLCGHSKNYLSDLAARGLVVSRPGLRGEGNGSGRGESVYLLTPAAMAMLAAAGKDGA